MAQKINRYVGRFAPSGKSVVDAPNMSVAIQRMVIDQGDEPIQVSLEEKGISVVLEEPYVTFSTVIKMKDGSVGFNPGKVYPEAFTLPQGSSVIFTAVPNTGFKFLYYTDLSTGEVIATQAISNILITKNITIGAIFDEEI